MKHRRHFLKLSLALGSSALVPSLSSAAPLRLNEINFSSSVYQNNNAQTIIVYLYGGASQLAGNLTNLAEIENESQTSYSYFNNLTPTTNNCWNNAGGDDMETLLGNGDMTLFRTCFSQVREDEGNKAHGKCTMQNQFGTFDTDRAGGIISNLALILQHNGVIGPNTVLPFITMEGETKFYAQGDTPVDGYLRPVGIDESFKNPYIRDYIRRWFYYTEAERDSAPDTYDNSDEEGGFTPALDATLDQLAQQHNRQGKVKSAFSKRAQLSSFIESLKQATPPDLGADAYEEDNLFAEKMEAAVNIMHHNPDTKVITVGTGGLGGWDDHSDARNYERRMQQLFSALRSAVAHLKAIGKDGSINIMVFGEFGRNVNLNNAQGWDHGNLQNLYVLGGKDYFNHKGIVGETKLVKTGEVNRLFLHPKDGSYWFEPLKIASTLYKIYGIDNPEVLTGGYGVIDPLFT